MKTKNVNIPYYAVPFIHRHDSSVSAGHNVTNQVADVVITGAVYLKVDWC